MDFLGNGGEPPQPFDFDDEEDDDDDEGLFCFACGSDNLRIEDYFVEDKVAIICNDCGSVMNGRIRRAS